MLSITLSKILSKKTTFNALLSGVNCARHLATTFKNPGVSLELKDGQQFTAKSFGAEKPTSGELVFTTSLVGYPESMTDPSYRGQILVFTQPLIGNYGVPGTDVDQCGLLKYFESDKIQVSGIVVSNYSAKYSHWNAVESLASWCRRFDIPALTEVDTRALTKLLREKGSTIGRVNFGNNLVSFQDPNKKNLVAEVSTKTVQVFNKGGDVVIGLIDCGIKNNIIRCLASRGAEVRLLPWDADLSKEKYDGLFISNGPGDPSTCGTTIDNLKKEFAKKDLKPIFGICMGNLLMGLAAGGKSYKLKFGNRGHNQPALNLVSGKGVITSQNHGYAIQEDSLPSTWKPYFRNVNDGSNEGLAHTSKPFSSVQFHPEYMGGPQDSEFLFDSFLHQVRAHKMQNQQIYEANEDLSAAI